MPERTVIQWNKDDLDELGILKVDCLAWTCSRPSAGASSWCGGTMAGGSRWPMFRRTIQEVYAMIRRADTMGVFQIESRAQMSMLPRLKPRCFYDLVIEVAIVRPGPDPGQHGPSLSSPPQGEEPVDYPNDAVRRRAGKDAGRAAVSGAGDAAGDGGGRIHAGRGRPVSPGDGRLATAGHDRPVPRETARRHARQRLFARSSPRRSSADPRLRRLRLSRIARRQLRPAGLRVGLAEVPLSGRRSRPRC